MKVEIHQCNLLQSQIQEALSKKEQAILQKRLDELDYQHYWNEMKFRTINEKACTQGQFCQSAGTQLGITESERITEPQSDGKLPLVHFNAQP